MPNFFAVADTRPRTPLPLPTSGVRRTWHAIAARMELYVSRHIGRRQLRDLDDHLLSDIGIGRAEALAEADKPFWRT